MFKDSPIARDFKLSKTKCSYVIKFGLAPYFQNVLVSEIQKSLYYSVSFDEALNRSSRWIFIYATGVYLLIK